MGKTRIQLTDTVRSAIMKLGGGNPGGLRVASELFSTGEVTDPDSATGGLGVLLDLDTLGIYESRIWMLYKDVCGEDIIKTHAILRGWQLGLVCDYEIEAAIDGVKPLDTDAVLAQVQARLPAFGRA
jgi:hypothetical protein